jgi:hypothetical protein
MCYCNNTLKLGLTLHYVCLYNEASNIIEEWDLKIVTFNIRTNNKIMILKNVFSEPFIKIWRLVGGWEES